MNKRKSTFELQIIKLTANSAIKWWKHMKVYRSLEIIRWKCFVRDFYSEMGKNTLKNFAYLSVACFNSQTFFYLTV